MRRAALGAIVVATLAAGCGKSTPQTTSTGSTTVPATTATPPAPKVTVVKSGFAQRGNQVGYGLILRNTSASADALGVTVTVDVLSRANKTLDTDVTRLSVIPATATLYFGGERFLDPGDRAATLRPRIGVATGGAPGPALPSVRNLRTRVHQGLRVTGVIDNALGSELSGFARIGIVLFGAGDRIVGGGFAYPPHPVPPGGHERFDTGVGVAATNPADVKEIRASADSAAG